MPPYGEAAMAGDGQVIRSNVIMKQTARKVRRLYEGKVLAGFAGRCCDAFNKDEHQQFSGNLERAAVELHKWR